MWQSWIEREDYSIACRVHQSLECCILLSFCKVGLMHTSRCTKYLGVHNPYLSRGKVMQCFRQSSALELCNGIYSISIWGCHIPVKPQPNYESEGRSKGTWSSPVFFSAKIIWTSFWSWKYNGVCFRRKGKRFYLWYLISGRWKLTQWRILFFRMYKKC